MKKRKEVINRQLPEYWKLQVFYCNKKDKSIVVPARHGFGFALNYGRRVVQIGVGVFCVVAIAAVVLLFVL